MCGRFALTEPKGLQKRFKTSNPLPAGIKPNYNAAPTQQMPVIIEVNGKPQIQVMHWGIIPVWAKDKPRFAFSTFNARAESLIEKPMWKKLFASKRCLVPATGFYEWKKTGSTKQPYYIKVKNQEIFAMAGLYDSWIIDKPGEDKAGQVFGSFTIITTTPNIAMKPIHDRMPVVLEADEEADWLNPAHQPADLMPLLDPYSDKRIEMYEVDRAVGNVKNNSLELTYPLEVE